MKLSERAQVGFKKKEGKKEPVVPQPRMVTRHSDGIIEARDGHGRLLAHYNPKTNETRDPRGDIIGLGNLLPRIITEATKKAAAEAPRKMY